ncbi:hypothetical protein SKAU_G00269370, partial [Synaphobranchus kaupii]
IRQIQTAGGPADKVQRGLLNRRGAEVPGQISSTAHSSCLRVQLFNGASTPDAPHNLDHDHATTSGPWDHVYFRERRSPHHLHLAPQRPAEHEGGPAGCGVQHAAEGGHPGAGGERHGAGRLPGAAHRTY